MAALYDSFCGCYMAQTSNNLARDYGITREEQDAFALRSQQRAAAAWESCRLSQEVVPVEVGKGKRAKTVERDDHLRPEHDDGGAGGAAHGVRASRASSPRATRRGSSTARR